MFQWGASPASEQICPMVAVTSEVIATGRVACNSSVKCPVEARSEKSRVRGLVAFEKFWDGGSVLGSWRAHFCIGIAHFWGTRWVYGYTAVFFFFFFFGNTGGNNSCSSTSTTFVFPLDVPSPDGAGLTPSIVSYGAVMAAVDWERAVHLLEQLQVPSTASTNICIYICICVYI